jgi:hypothetical protein
MLLPLAQSFADSHPDLACTWQVIFDIAGVIGLLVILLVIITALTMLPDFFRYLKLSSM